MNKNCKNYLRSTMKTERLSGLKLLSVERELADKIDFESTITRFATLQSRRSNSYDISQANDVRRNADTFNYKTISVALHLICQKCKSNYIVNYLMSEEIKFELPSNVYLIYLAPL